jgi:hypothetical protein
MSYNNNRNDKNNNNNKKTKIEIITIMIAIKLMNLEKTIVIITKNHHHQQQLQNNCEWNLSFGQQLLVCRQQTPDTASLNLKISLASKQIVSN